MLCKISQSSKENTCHGVFLNSRLRVSPSSKKNYVAGIFLWILINFFSKAILKKTCKWLFLSTFTCNQLVITKVHLGPCQTSKMERFAKLVSSFQPLSIFAKRSILDIWQGSGYASSLLQTMLTWKFRKTCCVFLLGA